MSGLEYEVVTTPERLGAIASELLKSSVVGIDLETTSLDPYLGTPRILSLNTGTNVYVIDLWATGGLGPLYEAMHNPQMLTGEGRPLWVGQNLKFDQKWLLHHYGVELWPVFDTFRASHLLHAGRRREHDLLALYARELEKTDCVPQMGDKGWSGDLTKQHYDYAAEDVTFLPLLFHRLRAKLKKARLLQIALIEFQAILPEASMELNGFRLDTDMWRAVARENERKTEELREELLREMPHPKGQRALFGDMGTTFNLNSPQQVLESFARRGIKMPNTNDTTLAQYAAVDEMVDKFRDYREVSKKVAAFGEKYLVKIDKDLGRPNIHPHTGRIHCSYFPYTGAGRYACSKPNLQQIPRGKAFRDCFRPEPGHVLIVCDYSQVELRLMAELSQDPVLISLYKQGIDVHSYTASIVLGVPLDQVTKKQRQLAKPINFGLIYGLMPAKLVVYAKANYGVNMTEAEAQEFWARFFEEYRGVREWQLRELENGKRTRQSRTLLGRRRFLDSETEHNAFLNTPDQGSGADGLKLALANVYQRLKKFDGLVKMVHMVHDEIVLECPDDPDLIAAAEHELKEGMEEAMRRIIKSVPVIAEPEHGCSWAEGKG